MAIGNRCCNWHGSPFTLGCILNDQLLKTKKRYDDLRWQALREYARPPPSPLDPSSYPTIFSFCLAQTSPQKSRQQNGSPKGAACLPDDEQPSLQEVLLSITTQGTTVMSPGTAADAAVFNPNIHADSDDNAPTSWSFAARQRLECARLGRAFRWARQRVRQELRGLALEHSELLLGAVRRINAVGGYSGGGRGPVRSEGTTRRREHELEPWGFRDGAKSQDVRVGDKPKFTRLR